jgi:hypothetical protein
MERSSRLDWGDVFIVGRLCFSLLYSGLGVKDRTLVFWY